MEMSISGFFFSIALGFDKLVNWTAGKWNRIWSDYGGEKGQTISSSLGAEEAEVLYKAWVSGQDITKIDDIPIPMHHILGEFSSDLCDLFQRHHALRAIDWKYETEIVSKYPGIKGIVDDYLKAKGVC
jgi:hypothetical protein